MVAACCALLQIHSQHVVLVLLLMLQVTEMNGKMVGSKPLYVALAQRKEERRARLQVRQWFPSHHVSLLPMSLICLSS